MRYFCVEINYDNKTSHWCSGLGKMNSVKCAMRGRKRSDVVGIRHKGKSGVVKQMRIY